MADCLKQCPKCTRTYCVSECKYIRFCRDCGRTTLCDDCAEEDRDSFAGLDGPEDEDEVVELVGACQTYSCPSKFCEECLKRWKCAGCGKKYCSPCMLSDLCSSCVFQGVGRIPRIHYRG